MSTRIWRKNTILLLLVVAVLAACTPRNDSTDTDDDSAVAAPASEVPRTNMENSPNPCRIRTDIPLEGTPTLRLPELDVQALLEQDQALPKDVPLPFATSTEVNLDPANDGQWQDAGSNVQVWRLRIDSPQALSISLGFTTFHMPSQGCLFVYSPEQAQILGPYTTQDNEEHGQLWTPTVEGEEVFLELSIPQDQISQLQLVLGFVNQGYKK